jgi:hypothetical protein
MRARVLACVSIALLSGLCQCALMFDLSALDQTGGAVLGLDDAGDVQNAAEATGEAQAQEGGSPAPDEATVADAAPTMADDADGTSVIEPDVTDAAAPGRDVADVSVAAPDVAAEASRDAPADVPADVPRDVRPDVPPPFDAASCSSFPLSPSTTVAASSVRFANYANQAIDKNFTTRWESTQQNDQPGVTLPPQWIYLDFGAHVFITDVQIDWQDACAASYDLQVSNDATNWTTIPGGGVIGNGKSSLNPPADWSMAADTPNLAGIGRYLRVYMTARCQIAYGYSIWEMRVYGHGVTTCSFP